MESGVSFSFCDEILIAKLSGEIDHHVARGEREEIDKMLFSKKPKLLVLDFSGVKFMDSSGIGLIIGRSATAEGVGCKIKISGLSEGLKRIVRLSGVEKIKNLTVD